MKLLNVYEHPEAIQALYRIMAQRLKEPGTNISHTAMPSLEDHTRFFNSKPYAGWYLIMGTRGVEEIMGACYITKANELGIYIWPHYRGKGHATQALQTLMAMHTPAPPITATRAGKYLARIHPNNKASQALFERLGFQCYEHTYGKD